MDGDSPKPLTTEEAKARLRAAADRISPSSWFQRHHWGALGLAIVSGFLVSRIGLPMAARTVITRSVAPLLLGAVMRELENKTYSYHKTHSSQRD